MLIDLVTPLAAPREARRLSRFWAPRPTAIQRLHDALANDLVLLRGPAGVGKTSLLQQFAASLEQDPAIGVQFIDGSSTRETLALVSEAFQNGPAQHVLIIDGHRDDGRGVTSDDVLEMLRTDPALRVVAATRHVTGLESPLVSLTFDSHIVPAAHLLMDRTEIAAVMERNGVDRTDEAVEHLAERTHGWPALVQLAGAHLRLEGLPMRSRDDAIKIAAYVSATFTRDLERRLPRPVTDEIKLLAVPPFVTAEIAAAIGIDSASTGGLMDELRDAGVVWPSTTRLVLAEPVRDRWMRDLSAQQPELVERARTRLLDHLRSTGEPLLAGRLAVDAGNWSALSSVLQSAGSQIWAQDAAAFDELGTALRTHAKNDPRAVSFELTFDPETAESTEAPSIAVAALAQLPDAKTAAANDLPALMCRVHLLRSSGRFALAIEAATILVDSLRRRADAAPEFLTEAWYQVAMTHIAMGNLRDATMALGLVLRSGGPAQRVRARGTSAVLALLDGDANRAAELVPVAENDQWVSSPWGEPLRLASAWLALEDGHPDQTLEILRDVPATRTARELWPLAASLNAVALLQTGAASNALGALRSWSNRTRSTPPSHFQSTQILLARAKVMIALRQARKATALFEGPFGLAPTTAPAIAQSLLYAGRAHDAYVMAVKWTGNAETTPRALLDHLIISIIADVRLNGPGHSAPAARRAEALSQRHGLWDPWSTVAPEDREAVFGMLSESAQRRLTQRPSMFESSVSVPHLTKREQVVLSRLTPTSTIAEIARVLVVSPNTVKTQLQSLYRKLEVSDRSSAIRAAHAWGLIDADRVH